MAVILSRFPSYCRVVSGWKYLNLLSYKIMDSFVNLVGKKKKFQTIELGFIKNML